MEQKNIEGKADEDRSCAAPGSAIFAAPWQSPAELGLRELAREYIDRTEAYDRTVCTGPIRRGGIMPVTSEERRLCTHNAISIRDRLFSQVRELGFGWGDWICAIQRACMSHRTRN